MTRPGPNGESPPDEMLAELVASAVTGALLDSQQARKLAGRSEAGRRWAIICTELEKLEAIVSYYNKGAGLKAREEST